MTDTPETIAELAPPPDRRELLLLLDHVDSLVRWCSCYMTDVPRYKRGAGAMWAVVHRLAGDDEAANNLIREHDLLGAPPL